MHSISDDLEGFMKVGMFLFVQNFEDVERVKAGSIGSPVPADAEVVGDDLRLGDLAEPLGFDSLFAVEHHFSPYAMTCNPLHLLTYFAGRTERIGFGTAVVVLPWHDPIRVAEDICYLSHMTKGRPLYIGLGRGMAPLEFDRFRIDFGEATGRMLEGAEIIQRALSQQTFSFEGEHFTIPQTSLRPQPLTDLSQSLYGAAISLESLDAWTRMGIGQIFAQVYDDNWLIERVKRFEQIRSEHGWPTCPPIIAQHVYCSESQAEIDAARQMLDNCFRTAAWHYDIFNGPVFKPRFDGIPSGSAGDAERERIKHEIYADAAQSDIVGTPEYCLERMTKLQQISGASQYAVAFKLGGMPYEMAEASARLFAEKVLPGLQALPAEPSFAIPYAQVAATRAAGIGAEVVSAVAH